jgi:hypothetical protein
VVPNAVGFDLVPNVLGDYVPVLDDRLSVAVKSVLETQGCMGSKTLTSLVTFSQVLKQLVPGGFEAGYPPPRARSSSPTDSGTAAAREPEMRMFAKTARIAEVATMIANVATCNCENHCVINILEA